MDINGRQEPFKKEKHVYWAQYTAVIVATIVSTLAGINFAWPSPSIPKLLAHDQIHFNLTKEDASYIAITAPVGGVVGGPLSALLVDLIGRKKTLLLSAIPQLISLIFIYFCDSSIGLLYAARFLGGIGEGVNFTIMAIYIGEIAHPSIRGNLGSYISLTLRLGILMINVIGSFFSIANTALIFLFLPILFVCVFVWMPETPYYLLMKDRRDDARRSLQFLRQKHNVDDELDRLSTDVQRQLSESGTIKDLFTIKTNFKALLIGIGLRTVQQFSGISAFSLYTQILFKDATDSISPIASSIIYSTIQLIVTFASSRVVDRAGRRPMLIYSGAACFIDLLIGAIYFTVRDFTDCDVSAIKWLPLAVMIVFIVVFALGLGTIVNIMLGELFSASIKPKALCVLNIYFAVAMTATTKFFQVLNDWNGLSIPFYVFSAWCLFGVLFAYYYVPETKGKSLEEIQQYLKGTSASYRNNNNCSNK